MEVSSSLNSMIVINFADPATLTPKKAKHLGNFLYHNHLVYKKYSFVYGPGLQIDKITYLSHALVFRHCGTDPCDFHYDILGEKLTEGAFGNIIVVLGTLKFTYDKSVFFETKTQLVIKWMHSNKHIHLHAFQEFKMEKRVIELHAKRPTYIPKRLMKDTSHSFMAMKLISGIDFFTLLQKVKKKEIILSTNTRLRLAREFLRASIKQLDRLDIVHRDIKPENIMIDLNTSPIKVVFIDFAFGKEASEGEIDKKIYGTFHYFAPEQFQGKSSKASDRFTIGKMLALMMGAADYVFDSVKEAAEVAHENFLVIETTLFQGIPDLTPQERTKISKCIKNLLQVEPELRPSLLNALLVFEFILYLRRNKNFESESFIALGKGMEAELAISLLAENNNLSLPDYLLSIREILTEKIKLLPDKHEIINEFLNGLDVHLFFGALERQEVITLFDQLVNSFWDNLKKLNQIAKKIHFLQFNIGDPKDRWWLRKMGLKVGALLVDAQLKNDLDYIADQNRRLKRHISRIQWRLQIIYERLKKQPNSFNLITLFKENGQKNFNSMKVDGNGLRRRNTL